MRIWLLQVVCDCVCGGLTGERAEHTTDLTTYINVSTCIHFVFPGPPPPVGTGMPPATKTVPTGSTTQLLVIVIPVCVTAVALGVVVLMAVCCLVKVRRMAKKAARSGKLNCATITELYFILLDFTFMAIIVL